MNDTQQEYCYENDLEPAFWFGHLLVGSYKLKNESRTESSRQNNRYLIVAGSRGMEPWDHFGDSGELDIPTIVMAVKLMLRARPTSAVSKIVMQDTVLDYIVMDRRASRIQDSVAREEISKVVGAQVVAEAMELLLKARHRVFCHQLFLPMSPLVQATLGSMVTSKNSMVTSTGRSSPSCVIMNLTTAAGPEMFQQIQKSPLDPVLCNALVQGTVGSSPPLKADEADKCKRIEEEWGAINTLATRFCRRD